MLSIDRGRLVDSSYYLVSIINILECKWYGKVLCDGSTVQVYFHSSSFNMICPNSGFVPMVVSAEVFQIQDVSEEQILDRCNLR